MNLSFEGEVLYEQGDPKAVVALLEERVEVLERVSIPDSVLRLQYMLSAAHWLLGNRLECRATTRKGKPCQRMPLPHNGYCPSHQHLAAEMESVAA